MRDWKPSCVWIDRAPFLVKLAETPQEIEQAQSLRAACFLSASQSPLALEQDAFDEHADHLLVLDQANKGQVVGTYRLMRESQAGQDLGFYSAQEFDLSFLKQLSGNKLELGRSCVEPAYRKSAVVTLLWLGCGAYVAAHQINLMFGCASFNGLDPNKHKDTFTYLTQFCHPPQNIEIKTRADCQSFKTSDFTSLSIDPRQALKSLPSLIKGYVNMGGWFGHEGYVDEEFNCLDLLLCVDETLAPPAYHRKFKRMDYVRREFI